MFSCSRVLAALVAVGLLGGTVACQSSTGPGGPEVAATHQVTYLVQGTGRISFEVNVGYTGADGSSGSDSTSGPDPLWSKQITTTSNVTQVTLTASASGGSAESTVRCNIVVDGVEVANKSSQFTCEAEFDLDKLAAVRSAQPPTPSPTAPATQAASPVPPPAPPAPAAGCGYVTDDEMLAAVTDNFTAMNPSVSSSGDATSCNYHIGGDYGSDGNVTLAWAKGAKVDAETKRGSFPVPGVGAPAYASPTGDVKIQASKGVLSLNLFGYSNWDHLIATVIAIYKAAAPRLR